MGGRFRKVFCHFPSQQSPGFQLLFGNFSTSQDRIQILQLALYSFSLGFVYKRKCVVFLSNIQKILRYQKTTFQAATYKTWEWESIGLPFDYRNWNLEPEYKFFAPKDCLKLDSKTYKWIAVRCYEPSRSYGSHCSWCPKPLCQILVRIAYLYIKIQLDLKVISLLSNLFRSLQDQVLVHMVGLITVILVVTMLLLKLLCPMMMQISFAKSWTTELI